MNADLERIVNAHTARVAAEAEERDAIVDALRKRSVPQAEIARITGVSTETIRQLRKSAGIAPNKRKVRFGRTVTVRAPDEHWPADGTDGKTAV
jgi:transposase-like protein